MVASLGLALDDVKGMTVDGVASGTALQAFLDRVDILPKDDPLHVIVAYLIAQLPSLTSESGDATALLHSAVPLDAIATLATATVTGGTYAGRLSGFAGVSVAPSPVSYDSDGDPVVSSVSTAWVLDFNGVRKVDRLFVTDSALRIALVLPWMGNEWGGKSLFPLTAPGFSTSSKPKPVSPAVADAAFPETESAKLLVQFSTGTTEQQVLDELNVRAKTRPSNVRVSVGDRPPFSVHPEVLTAPVPLSDFAAEVNSYLETVRGAGATGAVPVVLKLTTDAPGVLGLDAPVLRFDRTASGGFGESKARTFEFPVQGEQLTAVQFPAESASSWQIKRLGFDLIQNLERWQAFPRDVATRDARRRTRVLPDLNLAQAFSLQTAVPLAGAALHLAADSTAELLLELRPDADGLPGDTPLASQALSVPAGTADWRFVELPSPMDIDAGRPYWWVLKASTGVASWTLDAVGAHGPARFDRDGAGWRELPGPGAALSAVFRLLRGAAVDESPLAFEVDVIGAASPPRLSLEGERLELDFSSGDDSAPSTLNALPENGQVELELRLRAHARGDLTLGEVSVQYEPGDVPGAGT